jgi:cystathionine gamma-synthase
MGVTHAVTIGGPSIGYTRSGTAGGSDLEHLLARIDGGEGALAFSSGISAAQAALAQLEPGSHLIFEANGYYEFRSLIARQCAARGIAVDLVDLSDPTCVAAAMRPGKTAMIWAELPANPQWQMPDLAALSSIARKGGATLLVDATVATPIHCRPLEHGADVILHSATKYLNGHGDLTAGVLIFRSRNDMDGPLSFRTEAGTVLTPFSEWLLLRGLRTLAVRMERASASALAMAQWLADQGGVMAVHYPGLATHPQHDVAMRQYQRGFGAMLSIRLGSRSRAAELVGATRIFNAATSLGSTESLIEHRAATEGDGSRCPDDLVRLSIGLEDVGDLIVDLGQALSSLTPD